MNIDAKDTAALARALYDAMPDNDLLPIDRDKDCASIDTLDKALVDAGDPLFKFAVREIIEGAATGDGQLDLDRASELLERAIDDLQRLRDAVKEFNEG